MIRTEVRRRADAPAAGCVVVRVAGEVDIASVAALAEALTQASERARTDGSAVVVCDLSGVTFFAVAGLHCLQRAGDAMRAAGIAPRLVLGAAATTMPVLALMVAVCGWPVHVDLAAAVTTTPPDGAP